MPIMHTKKKVLTDRHVNEEAMEELAMYFAVLDGHGGAQISEHVSKTLHKNIMTQFRATHRSFSLPGCVGLPAKRWSRGRTSNLVEVRAP